MSKSNDHRLTNLRRLIDDAGGPSSLAKKLGYSNASFLVQMAGPNPMRKVTEKTARAFEEKLGLPAGHLDQPSAPSAPPVASAPPQSVPFTVDLIRLVGKVLDEEHVSLPPLRFADLVAFALVESEAQRKMADADQIRRVVALMK